MFKVNSSPSFRRSVHVRVPNGDGYLEESFTATFRLLPASRMSAESLATDAGQRAFLEEAVIGLEDIVDDDGKALDNAPAVRDAVFDRLDARAALFDAYTAASKELAAKN